MDGWMDIVAGLDKKFQLRQGLRSNELAVSSVGIEDIVDEDEDADEDEKNEYHDQPTQRDEELQLHSSCQYLSICLVQLLLSHKP